MSLSAHSPDGSLWILYASDEVPNLLVTKAPARGLITDTVYEAPVWFSTSRTLARRWAVDNNGTYGLQPVSIPEARVEYIEFVTPAGVSWVLGLGDDALLYLELFTSGVPTNRRQVSTAMHKGRLLYVADPRFRPPRPGDDS